MNAISYFLLDIVFQLREIKIIIRPITKGGRYEQSLQLYQLYNAPAFAEKAA
jgi:hypothetical protein